MTFTLDKLIMFSHLSNLKGFYLDNENVCHARKYVFNFEITCNRNSQSFWQIKSYGKD